MQLYKNIFNMQLNSGSSVDLQGCLEVQQQHFAKIKMKFTS